MKTLFYVILFSLTIQINAFATQRSCKGQYQIRVLGVVTPSSGAQLSFNPPIHNIRLPYYFKSTGKCGSLVQNRCRRRASQQAFSCMQAQSNNIDVFDSFTACSNNHRNPRYVRGHFGYRMREKIFADYMKIYACAAANHWFDRYNPRYNPTFQIKVDLDGVVSGNKGCGGNNSKKKVKKLGTHIVSCYRKENARTDVIWNETRFYNGGPNGIDYNLHYKHFTPKKPNHLTCRRSCMQDSKCVAWSYRKPYDIYGPLCLKFAKYYSLHRGPISFTSGTK